MADNMKTLLTMLGGGFVGYLFMQERKERKTERELIESTTLYTGEPGMKTISESIDVENLYLAKGELARDPILKEDLQYWSVYDRASGNEVSFGTEMPNGTVVGAITVKYGHWEINSEDPQDFLRQTKNRFR